MQMRQQPLEAFIPRHRHAVFQLTGMRHRGTYLLVGAVASAFFVVAAMLTKIPGYRVAPLFLLPALWGVYLLRHRLHVHPFHFGVYAAALVLHDLGAFGMYGRGVFGVSFDVYVHFLFAVAVAFILHRALRRNVRLKPWQAAGATLLFVMGLGALHEVMEYGTYLVLGEERGMLKPSTSYALDGYRDLLNNLLGALTALLAIAAWRAWNRRRGIRGA